MVFRASIWIFGMWVAEVGAGAEEEDLYEIAEQIADRRRDRRLGGCSRDLTKSDNTMIGGCQSSRTGGVVGTDGA